jgi:uncharacterized Zn finger protein (UPF0148 family)
MSFPPETPCYKCGTPVGEPWSGKLQPKRPVCPVCAWENITARAEAAERERDDLRDDWRRALRAGHEMTLETQSMAECVDDLVRIIREQREKTGVDAMIRLQEERDELRRQLLVVTDGMEAVLNHANHIAGDGRIEAARALLARIRSRT